MAIYRYTVTSLIIIIYNIVIQYQTVATKHKHALTDNSMVPQLSGEEVNPSITYLLVTKDHKVTHMILL